MLTALALLIAGVLAACADDGGGETSTDNGASVANLVLTSPSGGTVQVDGTYTNGELQVSVDGELQPQPLALAEPGPFTISIYDVEPGAHSICINEVCGRVMVKDPNTVGSDEIKARVDAAWEQVGESVPMAELLPAWQLKMTGPTAGIGGTTLADAKEILVASGDRSVNEFFLTMVHEVGHALDVEHLTDADRDRFRELRGFAADEPWSPSGQHGGLAWASPAEDFAEVVAAAIINGHIPRSSGQQPPDAETIAAVREMTGLG